MAIIENDIREIEYEERARIWRGLFNDFNNITSTITRYPPRDRNGDGGNSEIEDIIDEDDNTSKNGCDEESDNENEYENEDEIIIGK